MSAIPSVLAWIGVVLIVAGFLAMILWPELEPKDDEEDEG